MKKRTVALIIQLIAIAWLSGCATYASRVDNSAGRASKYIDLEQVTNTEHVGIEAPDIVQMCDEMMRSMMAEPRLSNARRAPHVLIDSEGFINESSETVNLNMITGRLKVSLTKAARGRMRFVGRHAVALIEKEKELKDRGVVGQGTIPFSRKTLGVDYRLTGRITSYQNVSNKTGLTDQLTQIEFQMIDMQTGEEIWNDIYDFRKVAADDVIYR
jgi:PBP1b-binding outer membrane lipoprotein LpoB